MRNLEVCATDGLDASPLQACERLPFAGAVLCLLAGCAVGPNYKRPPVDSPATFVLTTLPPTRPSPIWNGAGLSGQCLQALIREALTNNYDLRIA